jgi:hypothetical protein
MSTIPASDLVTVNPAVLAAGGDAIDLNGLLLTQSTRVPVGAPTSFGGAAPVGAFFGLASAEKAFADIYFAGSDNSNVKPGAMLAAQYPTVAVAAYLRGAATGLALAAVQQIKPTVVTGSIGGVVTGSVGASFTGTGSGTNLTTSAVTGIISAGDIIAGTGVPAGTRILSQTSGTTGGAGVYVTSAVTTSAGNALTATSTVLNVTAVTSGSLQATDAISGTNVVAATTVSSQISGTAGGVGLYRLNQAQLVASTAITALSSVLKVTVAAATPIVAGQLLTGTNVAASSRVVSQLSGTTGGVGLYTLSASSTTISESITGNYDVSVVVNGTPATSASVDLSTATSFSAAATLLGTAIGQAVTFDSISGAFVVTSPTTGVLSTIAYATGGLATALSLTQALGAVLSQGADAVTTPSAFMSGLVVNTRNWASFTTIFDPDNGAGNANKLAFAAWTSTQNNRWAYVPWDTDLSGTVTVPATSSLGYLLQQANYTGSMPIATPTYAKAAFLMGAIASVDFTQANGRTTMAYRSQAGQVADITDQNAAHNLAGNPQTSGDFGNGYNFYGVYGTANPSFVLFQRGTVTGPFKWIDTYINQIWLNAQFQLALIIMMVNMRTVPYNAAGRALIEAALMTPINAGLNFGAFRSGVSLSAAQIAAVNADANANIAPTLSTRGWYLQVLDADPTVRANRGSPPCRFWYMDGESVQSINLGSVAVQ